MFLIISLLLQCYYVGGTKDAATYILNEITRPMGYFKTVDKICEDLKKKDPQICSLKYGKRILYVILLLTGLFGFHLYSFQVCHYSRE